MSSFLKKVRKMSRIDYSKYTHSEYAIHMGKLLLAHDYFCVKFWSDGIIRGKCNRTRDGLLAEDFFILVSKLLDESSNENRDNGLIH